MSDRVQLQIDGGTATLSLNRPDKHNGVDRSMLKGVIRAQKQLKRERALRAVIVRGEGPSFCAGIDAKDFMLNPLRAVLSVGSLFSPWRNAFQTWSLGFRELGVPVIAVIHGNCFGAGIQLALGADIRIARPDARVSIMEARLGLVPDMGGPTLLRELLPLDVAKELTMTGRILSGIEACELGLVTHVSEEPLARAAALVEEIAARSPDAVAAGKFLLQRVWGASEYMSLVHERGYQRRVIGRPNQRLALQRSQKKRATEEAREDAAAPNYAPRSIEF
ncbi:MAG TPA: crotonase/enoyl-CoA hydratase family protein [Polyangiales bacterium]|nr:crotonase/enoyl-CoA hydratase family protein [Polyangiales bacterium]